MGDIWVAKDTIFFHADREGSMGDIWVAKDTSLLHADNEDSVGDRWLAKDPIILLADSEGSIGYIRVTSLYCVQMSVLGVHVLRLNYKTY